MEEEGRALGHVPELPDAQREHTHTFFLAATVGNTAKGRGGAQRTVPTLAFSFSTMSNFHENIRFNFCAMKSQ